MADHLVITTCRSCQAETFWAFTEAGKRMLVDAHPIVDGNLLMKPGKPSTIDDVGNYRPGSLPHVRVVGATIDLLDPNDDGRRFKSHFATCPNAADWRKGEPAPPTPGPTTHRTMHRSF